MSTITEPPIPPVINFTLAAAEKVKSLIDEENNLSLNLRVFIEGGGCSGFKYGFTFDEVIREDDVIIEKQLNSGVVKLLIDFMSFQYLQGADIDYREDVNSAQFVIRSNPNAKTSCGCGSSFSADPPP